MRFAPSCVEIRGHSEFGLSQPAADRYWSKMDLHLRELESEAIYVIRETVAEFKSPVLLYSIGKDSSVLLRLCQKAFWPSRIPFPVLHIDSLWKFAEMIAFRDRTAQELGIDLIVHTNSEGVERGIDPFSAGSAIHTEVMKTQALRQALDKYAFDAAIGGARRDEEKSRAKERIFSRRSRGHIWDPRRQRPEFRHIFNTKLGPDETMRVYPLSNWTELNIWEYVRSENIPVVPLYFAAERPVVSRGSKLIMVDDDRMKLEPCEKIEHIMVRFRTLGCYPLTGAVRSIARTIDQIIAEVRNANTSERQNRLIDCDDLASMERKKRDGYF